MMLRLSFLIFTGRAALAGSAYDSVAVTLTIRNVGSRTNYPVGYQYCPVQTVARLERTVAAVTRRRGNGPAEWDSARHQQCEFLGRYMILGPEESVRFRRAWPVRSILGDSLPAARYRFTAYAHLNGETRRTDAGSINLGE
jgi:hypothetical protein